MLKAVTSVSFTELKDTLCRHYPNMFDVDAWETECALQGLGVHNNLLLYLTAINKLGIKNECVSELMGAARHDGSTKAADLDEDDEECEDMGNLESDPTYMASFTCNTTRSYMFDMETEDSRESDGYEYIEESRAPADPDGNECAVIKLSHEPDVAKDTLVQETLQTDSPAQGAEGEKDETDPSELGTFETLVSGPESVVYTDVVDSRPKVAIEDD